MDRSPRSIGQLQRRVWCSSRGHRSVVYRREHPRRLEDIRLLAMDSRKTYISHHVWVIIATNYTWIYSWLWEEYSQVCYSPLSRVPIELT
jgi:hypothetical protein